MLNITEGKRSRSQKVVIYGAEGIGKTTLASQFPDPLFIDTEGGTSHLDVRRIEPADWAELLADVKEVSITPDICKTLVIDTADWAEQMATKAVIEVANAKSKGAITIEGIEDFGYSKGYTYLAEEFQKLLTALDKVINAGMNVVVTAHAQMRKFEQPDEMGAYDRWEMKLSKRVCPLLKEWCDLLLFCNYKTYVVQNSNAMEKAKVQGGKRVMYTTHHACWDAKNRHDLPDELPLSYDSIASIFEPKQKAEPAPKSEPKPEREPSSLEKVMRMIRDAEVAPEEVQRVAAAHSCCSESIPVSDYPDAFLNGWVIRHWNSILKEIQNNRYMEVQING